MIRLRIALGVASSLVAVAALSIVLAGSGEAQGNANGPNVTVVNTPLPVTGNVTATLAGNVSATIINPSDAPVLVRGVDAKELWQENRSVSIDPSFPDAFIDFDPVPAGKALVIEHINIIVADAGSDAPELRRITLFNTQPFGASTSVDVRYLVSQAQGRDAIADAVTKFYVAPGDTPRVFVHRSDLSVTAAASAQLTGYLVNYP